MLIVLLCTKQASELTNNHIKDGEIETNRVIHLRKNKYTIIKKHDATTGIKSFAIIWSSHDKSDFANVNHRNII